MKTYCKTCGFECLLVRQTEEQYPGQYATSFISDCCGDEVVDRFDAPFKYGELAQEYETQKSYEVSE